MNILCRNFYIWALPVLLVAGCGVKENKLIDDVSPAEHKHARMLLDNSLKYTDQAHGLADPVTGYRYQGWDRVT